METFLNHMLSCIILREAPKEDFLYLKPPTFPIALWGKSTELVLLFYFRRGGLPSNKQSNENDIFGGDYCGRIEPCPA